MSTPEADPRLSFALALLAGMIAQANAVVRRAHDNRVAAQWLDEVLTRIDIVGPNRMLYEGPLAGPLDDRFSWSAQITPEPLSDLYVVDVTIAWTTPAGQRTAEGHTLLMDPPGWREASVSWASLQ